MVSLEDELISLKIENAAIKEKMEALTQKEYETRQRLVKFQLLQSDFESEVEELNKVLKQYEEDISKIQTDHSEETNRLKSTIQNLESKLQEKEDSSNSEIKKLEEKILEVENRKPLLPGRNEDDSIISESLFKAEDQIEKLSEELYSYKNMVDNLKDGKDKLERDKYELVVRLDEMTSLLQAKKEELRSSLETLESVQEEKAILNSELAILRTPAADTQKRGNSLFAEVEENRQVVVTKLSAMKSKYERLKKSFSMKNIEISKLKAENHRLFNEIKEGKDQTYWIERITAYKERISDLQETVEFYKKRPESPQIITIDAANLNNLQWVTTVVENARQEVRELRQQMESKSSKHCFDAENRYEIQRENQRLKYLAQENKIEINDLKCKLEESQSLFNDLKLQIESNCTLSPTINELDQQQLADCKQKKVRFTEDTKEDIVSVKFAEETKENINVNF